MYINTSYMYCSRKVICTNIIMHCHTTIIYADAESNNNNYSNNYVCI